MEDWDHNEDRRRRPLERYSFKECHNVYRQRHRFLPKLARPAFCAFDLKPHER
jgi:hypothetical protein